MTTMSLMTTLMLSCRKATELVERRSTQPLSALERMQLWMHERACDGCRAFDKQSRTIDALMADRDTIFTEVPNKPLEERILKAIEGED